MDHSQRACQLPGTRDNSVAAPIVNPLQRRIDRAEADIRRLTEQLKGKERQLSDMGKALLRTVTVHHAIEERQETELESLRAMAPAWRTCRCAFEGYVGNSDGVAVYLPFMTETLSGMFDVMQDFWSDYDENNPPKSSVVARAIDERLNLKSQSDGEASRSAQTYASAIRPDWLKETDSRHHMRSRS
ncbi:hypothetical protein [Burkholderia sp. Ax-1724]|uniref:hypothetical protein n=1 Tax=Burkholderia sp. Ax-1724 TaxID=2608336 RepID=UPI00141E61F7|nr:hypothetical protein [Burkholderia sp. Ax-1724]NIF56088.1 hypothetical protein [Burkholderia sp. Ax-1724]